MKLVIATIFVLSSLTFVCSSTIRPEERVCEVHRRNAGAATASMHWDIRCDAAGDYLPLQCTLESPKWCACYDKEFRITQPSRLTRECECYLRRYRAQHNATADPCDIPECDIKGKFEKRQCCLATQKCRCVDAITGEPTTELVTDMDLRCN